MFHILRLGPCHSSSAVGLQVLFALCLFLTQVMTVLHWCWFGQSSSICSASLPQLLNQRLRPAFSAVPTLTLYRTSSSQVINAQLSTLLPKTSVSPTATSFLKRYQQRSAPCRALTSADPVKNPAQSSRRRRFFFYFIIVLRYPITPKCRIYGII